MSASDNLWDELPPPEAITSKLETETNVFDVLPKPESVLVADSNALAEARTGAAMRLGSALDGVREQNPDQWGQILSIADRTGIPPAVVKERPDQFAKALLHANLDPATLARQAPALAAWLSDPRNAVVAQDQLEPLARVGSAVSHPPDEGPDFANWFMQQAPDLLIRRGIGSLAYGIATMEQPIAATLNNLLPEGMKWTMPEKFMSDYEATMATPTEGVTTLPRKVVAGTLQAAPFLGSIMLTGLAGGEATPGLARVAPSVWQSIQSGVEQNAATFAWNYAQMAGPATRALERSPDENGKFMSPMLASAAGAAVGLVNGLLFTTGVPHMLGDMPPEQMAANLAMRGAIVRTLAKPSVASALLGFGARYGEASLTGVLMMGLSKAAETSATNLARTASGQPFGPAESPFRTFLEGAQSALTDFALVNLIGPAQGYYADMGRLYKAQADAALLRGVSEAREGVKDGPGRAEALQSLVSTVAGEDGPLKGALIPADKWAVYWQSQHIDPEEAADALVRGGRGALQAETVAGGDVLVPLDVFAARIAGTKHLDGLAPDIRSSADGWTPREAQEALPGLAAQAAEIAKTTVGVAEASPAERVAADVTEKMLAAGRPKAEAQRTGKLWGARYATRAERLGGEQSPWDLYQAEPLKVVGPEEAAPLAEAEAVESPQPPLELMTPEEFIQWSLRRSSEWSKANPEKGVFPPLEPGQRTAIQDAMVEGRPFNVEAWNEIQRSDHPLSLRDGYTIENGQYVYRGESSERPAIRSAAGRRFYQPGRRGFYGKTGAERVIGFLESGDASTAIHESGHAFVDELVADAALPDAPQQLKDDLAALVLHIGAESWEAATPEQREKLGPEFEKYLTEGKAPSQGLAGVFQRFRLWMLNLWRNVRTDALPQNVRDVFDRMLATDEEIQTAKDAMGLKPVFRSPLEAGKNAQEWAEYLASQRKATDAASQRVAQRMARERARETEAWWKEQTLAEKAKAEAAYTGERAVKAWKFLRTGETDNEALSALGKVKLDRSEVEKILGPNTETDATQDPPRAVWGPDALKRLGLVTDKDGLHPDDVASLMGYDSGEAMLRDVLAFPNRKTYVERTTDAAMKAMHPDLLADREALQGAAQSSLHGEETGEWLYHELRAIKAKSPDTQLVPHDAIKMAADLLVERMLVRDASSGRVRAAEQRHGDAALRAAAQGNWAKAYAEKQSQILAYETWKRLEAFSDRQASARRLFKRLQRDDVRGKLGQAGPEYRDAVDSILEAVGLRPVQATPEARVPFQKLVDGLVSDDALSFDSDAIQRLLDKPTVLRDLTVDQWQNVVDALTNIRQVADDALTILVAGKRQNLADLAGRIVAETDAGETEKSLPRIGTRSKRTMRERGRGLKGALLDPEALVGRLGPVARDVIYGGFERAWINEREMIRTAFRPILDALQANTEFQKRMWESVPEADRDLPIPEEIGLSGGLRRGDLLMVALNWGNDSNRQRLTAGYQWTEDQVWKVLDRELTKEDWDFVQSVWTAHEKYLWPLLKADAEATTGVAPKKIPAVPIKTRFGVYDGGYFPAVYDRDALSKKPVTAASRQAESIESMRPKFLPASTQKSHRQARVARYDEPLSLDFSLVPSHLLSVVHDVAFNRFVRDAGRVIHNPDVVAAMRTRLGKAYETQIKEWHRDVALNGPSSAVPKAMSEIMRGLTWVRQRFVLSSLGWNVGTVLAHIPNAYTPLATGEVKAGPWAEGLARAFVPGGWKAMHEEAINSSPLMAERADRKTTALVERLQDVTRQSRESKQSEIARNVRATAYIGIDTAMRLLETISWWSAKKSALRSGLSEAAANAKADAVVRGNYPSHNFLDKPAILRDQRSVGALMFAYTYYSKMFNVLDRVVHPAAVDFDRAQGVEKISAISPLAWKVARAYALVTVAHMSASLLAGRGAEQDESWYEWALRKALTGWTPTVPIMGGPIEKGISTGLGFVLHGKFTQRGVNPISAPGMAAVERLFTVAGKLASKKATGTDKAIALAETALMLRGIPSGQVGRTVGYGVRLVAGQAQPAGPFDIASGFTYGERKMQPQNLLTLAGTATGEMKRKRK